MSLPFYVAETQGYFALEGLTVQLDETVGGHMAFQKMLTGASDFATASEAVVMFNSFKRADFAIVATFVSSNDDAKIVVGPQAGITRPQQLAGKRIGTVIGASSQYYLDTLLLQYGIAKHGTQIQNVPPEEMGDALKNGLVDAIAIWEPFPFQVLTSVPGSKLLSESNVYVTTFNLISRKDYISGHDDQLVKLLHALERAQQFIATSAPQAQVILLKRLGLDQTFVDWIWPSNKYRLTLNQALIKTLEAEARWARQEGQVKAEQSPNYLDFIYSAPLRKVRADAVGIME
ncbi:MAG TPA: ABC transporter substrate-binding protein [Rhodospirillaceae bacterium]|nr:ABC transporter substrate-binding protein [Rhodospirillaceae bacterium]